MVDQALLYVDEVGHPQCTNYYYCNVIIRSFFFFFFFFFFFLSWRFDFILVPWGEGEEGGGDEKRDEKKKREICFF